MTSPSETIAIECPKCSERYTDWYRPSINRMLDDFDEDYLDQATSATCPACQHRVELDVLVVDIAGTWTAARRKEAWERE